MRLPVLSKKSRIILGVLIGSVWLFHGLYSKISGGIPRHELIVGRVLGERIAKPATLTVGILEVLLGLWVISGRARCFCALMQTLALISMNILKITFARDLLISAPGMVALNLGFISLIWWWARFGPPHSEGRT